MSSRRLRKVCRPIALTMQTLGGFRYAQAFRAARLEHEIDRKKQKDVAIQARVDAAKAAS